MGWKRAKVELMVIFALFNGCIHFTFDIKCVISIVSFCILKLTLFKICMSGDASYCCWMFRMGFFAMSIQQVEVAQIRYSQQNWSFLSYINRCVICGSLEDLGHFRLWYWNLIQIQYKAICDSQWVCTVFCNFYVKENDGKMDDNSEEGIQ